MKTTKRVLYLIGVVQAALGAVLLIPGAFAEVTGLEDAPAWVDWMFAMAGARALGFAYGMFAAARDPRANRHWIVAMVGVQAVDWLATLTYLIAGSVTLAQVTTAAFLPVVFVAVLVLYLLRAPAATARHS